MARPKTLTGWRGHLVGLAFMSVAIVGLCELVLSLYGDLAPADAYSTVHRRSQTPHLIFEPRPGAEARIGTADSYTTVVFNSHGFRGPEPSPPEREDVARIAAVGDSFTFGMGVNADEAWPARLGARLTRDDRPVEALNFGVCAYTIADDLAVLEHKTQPWRPDAIVLGYYFNDPDTLPLMPIQRAFLPPLSPYRLKLVHFGLMLRRLVDIRLAGDTSYFEMLHSDRLSYWSNTLATLERMRVIAAERDAPFVVAILPATPEQWDAYRLGPQHAKVAAACRARGIPVVDLLETLALHDPKSLRISSDDNHPTPFAHQLIAEALAPTVEAAVEGKWVARMATLRSSARNAPDLE